jgi:hypothetical protein
MKAPDFLFDPSSPDEPGNVGARRWDDTPYLVAFLAWCRRQGIIPEHTARLEVYDKGRGRYKAKLDVYELDAEGRKQINANAESFAKQTKTLTVTSMPPRPEQFSESQT